MIQLESRLWQLLEALRSEKDISNHCERWWELTDSDWILAIDVICVFLIGNF